MPRVAIIGLGAVTRNIHLPAYTQVKDRVEIVAGCDPDPMAGNRVRSKIPALYSDAEQMIDDVKPDIVAVCTPPALHREHCLLSLSKGCHVFCEKPMADSPEDAVAIAEAAKAAGRHVVVNTQFPFMQTFHAAKRMIGLPDFGRLLFMHAWQSFRRTKETEAGWRGEMDRRVCLEFGVHVFELARFFFESDPNYVFAHMPRPLAGEKADVVNTITLEFPDGRGAVIVLDRLHRGPHKYLEMNLDGEFASVHTSLGGEARFEIGMHTRERKPFASFHFSKGGTATLMRNQRLKVIGRDGLNPFASATALHLRQFMDAIDSDRIPVATAADNAKTLALVFASYESAETRKAVDMDEFLNRLGLANV